jgi:hypothetical protein
LGDSGKFFSHKFSHRFLPILPFQVHKPRVTAGINHVLLASGQNIGIIEFEEGEINGNREVRRDFINNGVIIMRLFAFHDDLKQ